MGQLINFPENRTSAIHIYNGITTCSHSHMEGKEGLIITLVNDLKK